MPHTEHVVASVHDFKDGEMQQVKAGERDILVARVDGEFFATGAYCTHYGAPLAEGALSGTRLVCPWHHACFSLHTGACQEPPAFDDLPRFDVRIDGDKVLVTLPEEAVEGFVPTMAPARPAADTRIFAILGGGAAGAVAAETLRRHGFRGRVVIISADPHLPYDRTLLSKDFLEEENDMGWIPARSDDFYDEHGIELMLGMTVTALDVDARTLHFRDGSSLRFDALLLALGSLPIPLPVDGSDLPGVYLLRSLDDSQAIVDAAKAGRRVVIVGSSFIGMECASALRSRGLDVAVVSNEDVPYESILGPEVGRSFQRLHEDNGVRFWLGTEVKQIVGDSAARGVRLGNGQELPADFVVIGIGVRPATDVLPAELLHKDGSVSVDASQRVWGAEGVIWAAGDLARYPDPLTGDPIRVEHWRVAQQHARTAARSMLGDLRPFDGVPLFWTKQHGEGFRYVGHATNWDEIVVDGDLDKRDMLVYYVKDGQLRAALGGKRDAELCAIEECMRLRIVPPLEQLRRGSFDWIGYLRDQTQHSA